jgi:DeoR family suf operon transcriptional repressor
MMLDELSKSTRERILITLLRNQRCTINDLAEAVSINPISVRHHIAKLQADGLVGSEEERHGVGRPRRIYYLTENGLEHFPTRYMRLTIRLLEQMKEHLAPSTVSELFSNIAEDMVENFTRTTNKRGLSMEERLKLMQRLLADEGFNLEWERKGDQYHIREVNCPYLHIGQNHPEVCRVDQTLISSVLEVPAEKIRCVLNGDSYCTYVVPNTIPD